MDLPQPDGPRTDSELVTADRRSSRLPGLRPRAVRAGKVCADPAKRMTGGRMRASSGEEAAVDAAVRSRSCRAECSRDFATHLPGRRRAARARTRPCRPFCVTVVDHQRDRGPRTGLRRSRSRSPAHRFTERRGARPDRRWPACCALARRHEFLHGLGPLGEHLVATPQRQAVALEAVVRPRDDLELLAPASSPARLESRATVITQFTSARPAAGQHRRQRAGSTLSSSTFAGSTPLAASTSGQVTLDDENVPVATFLPVHGLEAIDAAAGQ